MATLPLKPKRRAELFERAERMVPEELALDLPETANGRAEQESLDHVLSALKLGDQKLHSAYIYARSASGWWLRLAGLKILRGDSQGWHGVFEAIRYFELAIHCAERANLQEKTKWDIDGYSVSLLYAAIWLGLDADAEYLSSWFLEIDSKHAFFKERCSDENFIEMARLMVPMYDTGEGIQGVSDEITLNRLGVYSNLFDRPDEVEGFGEGLEMACDHHLIVSDPLRKSRSDGPFYHPLLCLFPVEILAYIRMREMSGLKRVEFEHPLMNTALSQKPSFELQVKDSVLLESCRLARFTV